MTNDNDEIPQWPSEVVAESFRTEIRARFEAHNVAYRAREKAEQDAFFRDHPEKRGQPGYDHGDRDSGAWSFYEACKIQIEGNVVTIVSPGPSIDMHIVHLFDNTTASWSKPWVSAVIVDGEPRIEIKIVLVATWDDSLDAAWRKEGNDKRQVLVELDEDEVHTFLELLGRAGDEGLPVRASIYDRLKGSLEYLP